MAGGLRAALPVTATVFMRIYAFFFTAQAVEACCAVIFITADRHYCTGDTNQQTI